MTKRLPLLFTLLALIALSASVAYWVLQLYKPEQRPLAAAPVARAPEPSVDAAATLFGGQAVTVMAANYQLTGVVSAGAESVAILVAEGQPPKALPVGKEFSPGVLVKEVHPRYVMLSEGGVLKRIDLATDAKPAANMAAPVPMEAPQQAQEAAPPPQEQEPAVPPGQPPEEPAPMQGQTPADRPPPQGAAPTATVPPPPAPPVQMPPATRNTGMGTVNQPPSQ